MRTRRNPTCNDCGAVMEMDYERDEETGQSYYTTGSCPCECQWCGEHTYGPHLPTCETCGIQVGPECIVYDDEGLIVCNHTPQTAAKAAEVTQ